MNILPPLEVPWAHRLRDVSSAEITVPSRSAFISLTGVCTR